MPGTVAIIGAGVGGLTAGCYGQLNGYDTRIFEMHNMPGGLCTAWQRKGYTFDGCIHWLVGSNPNTAMHRVWERIGALSGQEIIHHDEFVRVTGSDGRSLVQYTDLDQLEQHLLELSPSDQSAIRELIGAARAMVKMEIPVGKPRDLFGPLDGLRMMWDMRSFMKVFAKYSKISIGDFSARFTDPLIREMLTAIIDGRFNMVSLLATMGSLAARDAGWPIGGSGVFAQGAEARYRELGGTIHCGARVTDILVENDRAVGIRLAGGEEIRVDAVISAADGYTTLYQLLGGQYLADAIARYYSGEFPTITSVMTYMGVDGDLSHLPHSSVFPLESQLEIGGRVHHSIGFNHYGYDPTLCPPGKSIVRAVFYADYDYWSELSADRARYDEEKQRIAGLVSRELEHRYPEAGRIEAVDVVTPVTFTRYTGVWQGAYMSWINTPKSGMISIPQKLPGLNNFYMAGQWTRGSAGLPGSALSGRDAVQILCAGDGRRFED